MEKYSILTFLFLFDKSDEVFDLLPHILGDFVFAAEQGNLDISFAWGSVGVYRGAVFENTAAEGEFKQLFFGIVCQSIAIPFLMGLVSV